MMHTENFPPPVRGVVRAFPREQLPKDACWDASNVVHVANRIRKIPGMAQLGTLALPSAFQRGVVQTLLNGDTASWALTKTKIYEYTGAAWVDRTHGSGDYTSGDRWITDQVSNTDILLATNDKQQVQKLAPGGLATDLGGVPPFTKCYGVRQFRDFILYWGTTESGDFKETRIRWADILTYETFTGGLSGSQDLPGSDFILEIRPLTDDTAMIYRERSQWLMRWIGAPLVFAFEELAAKATDGPGAPGYGVASSFSVTPRSGEHEYISGEAFYRNAGASSIEYGELGRLLLHPALDQAKRDLVVVHVDPIRHLKWVYYPTGGATDYPNRALIEDFEAIHGEELAYWPQSFGVTGVGWWAETTIETWDTTAGIVSSLQGTWTSAAQLADQFDMIVGLESDNHIFRINWGLPSITDIAGNQTAINCEYEVGLFHIARLAFEKNPKSGFTENGGSCLLHCWVHFGSRGTQTFYVDIGVAENPADDMEWTPFLIPEGLTNRYRIDTMLVGKFFTYRIRCSGIGTAPEFGHLDMEFVPDSGFGL